MGADPDSQIWLGVLALGMLVLRSFFALLTSVLTNASRQRLLEIKSEQAQRFLKLLDQAPQVEISLESLQLLSDGFLVGSLFLLLRTQPTGFQLLVAIVGYLCWLVFADQLVRRLGRRYASQLGLRLAPVMRLFKWVLSPLTWLVSHLLAILSPNTADSTTFQPDLTRQEMLAMIENGQKNGVIESDEFEMFEGIIQMHRKMAREVAVPRTDAFMIDLEDDDQKNIDAILQQNYSRIPVYRHDKDKVLGVVHIKNVLKRAHAVGFAQVRLEELMQEPLFAPETIMIDDLLYEMKKSQNQMSILLDEYGGLVGLVTIEDLLEEIVGEIDDETDEADVNYRKIDAQHYAVQGKFALDEFNDLFGTHLESTDVDTIAGYVLTKLGRIPEDGQHLTLTLANGLILETGAMAGSRLVDLWVTLPGKQSTE